MTMLPEGFRLAGVHAGLKRNPQKQDLALVVSDVPATAAGVYTQNLIQAAPVTLDRGRTPGGDLRGVVINSGNANACTGERGLRDAHDMAAAAAAALGVEPRQVLVLSTGVIGAFLPMEKIRAGITAAAGQLARDEQALVSAARGMLTTDTCEKIVARSAPIAGRTVRLIGLAKGAAMIGPRMATMLGLVLTDAALDAAVAQQALGAAVEDSFNCVSVDGHMSTNDTVLLLANGASGSGSLGAADLKVFQSLLNDVCSELARAIGSDGEGATHLITIHVSGCATRQAAHRIAKTVAESPLVKTAIAGADPNWGRIVSAAGYAGVPFNPLGLRLRLNGCLLYEAGTPVSCDEKAVSHSVRENRETQIDLSFGEGSAEVRFWTTDLTAEYVRLNADYRT